MSDHEIDEKKLFFADIAKGGKAACKRCKDKCENGKLRIAKLVPNPFGTGIGSAKQWYHVDCLFESFKKQRATTKRIETCDDIEGWERLNDLDRDIIIEKLQCETITLSKNMENIDDDNLKSICPGPNYQENSEDNLFQNFCKICDEISNVSSYLEKTRILQKFLLKGSNNSKFEGNLYLWIKLLLPSAVKRIYNLQSKQLVKLFSKIFNVDQLKMLTHLEQGDVSETVRVFFESSKIVKLSSKSLLKLDYIDKFLEKLSHLKREDDQIEHFQQLTKVCSSNDLKMIIRLIKHDLRINAGPKHILEALNSEAYPMFQSSRNLGSVVLKFSNKIETNILTSPKKSVHNKKEGVSVQLMCPVSPMLAEECNSVEKALGKYPQGMFSEIKYDGERVQLHKQGNEFKFFSRNLKPVLDHKIARCREFIAKAFPKANDLILDSEIIVVDTKTGELLPFGSLGVHKKTQFESAEVCLFVFDCIYLNGEDLTKKSMKERRKILEENMCPIKNHIQLSEYNLIRSSKELTKMIAEVLKKGLEGLVLKNIDGVYEPGKRHWMKIKKDYLFDGRMADTADLVVLGGWFGTGKKGGKLSVFLMGCFDRDANLWKTVTKVSSGIDDKTLSKLQDPFKNLMMRSNVENIPKWLSCKKPMIPDFLAIDPQKMPVWEIIGAEFSKAEIHTADGISIRFPRIKRFRDDKSSDQSTELLQLKHLYKISKETATIDLKLLTDDIIDYEKFAKTTVKEEDDENIVNDSKKLFRLYPESDESNQEKKPLKKYNKNDKEKCHDSNSNSDSDFKNKKKDEKSDFENVNKREMRKKFVSHDIGKNPKETKNKNEKDEDENVEIEEEERNIKNVTKKQEKKKQDEQHDKKMKYLFDDNSNSGVDIDTKQKSYKSKRKNIEIRNINIKKIKSNSENFEEEYLIKYENYKVNVFDGILLFVPPKVRELVERELAYFFQWSGIEVNNTKECTHVIHKQNFISEDMFAVRSKYKPLCKHVNYNWLLDSIKNKELQPITKYPVILRYNINISNASY